MGRLLLFIVLLNTRVVVAQDHEWKSGPGLLHLDGIGIVQIPAHFEYQEIAIGSGVLKTENKDGHVFTLGSIRGDSSQLDFAYVHDSDARLSQSIMRVSAALAVNTMADRFLAHIQQQGLSIRVLENDHYDSRTESITYVVDSGAREGTGAAATRSRVWAFFCLHGVLVAGFVAPASNFIQVDSQNKSLLEGLVISAGETPSWLMRISYPSSNDIARLWPFAVLGLVVGAIVAMFPHWRQGRALLRVEK
jgi:hypothetical protein